MKQGIKNTELTQNELCELSMEANGLYTYKENGCKYSIEFILGRGGTAEVLLAVQEKSVDEAMDVSKESDKMRIIKLFRDSFCAENSYNREHEILSGINIKGIPCIYGYGKCKDGYWIAEEYLEGTSLDILFSMKRNFSLHNAIRSLANVCDILTKLHNYEDKVILHMDVKASNILINVNSGDTFLIDFGNAIMFCKADTSPMYRRKMISDRICEMVSEEYAAPEVINRGIIGEWTDVYSIGILLHKAFIKYYDEIDQLNKTSVFQELIYQCLRKQINKRICSMEYISSFLRTQFNL